jgi:hypothetical protein
MINNYFCTYRFIWRWYSLGRWFRSNEKVTDEQIRRLISRKRKERLTTYVHRHIRCLRYSFLFHSSEKQRTNFIYVIDQIERIWFSIECINNDENNSITIFKEHLPVSTKPDIHLSKNEQIHLNKCLSSLRQMSYFTDPKLYTCIKTHSNKKAQKRKMNQCLSRLSFINLFI